MKLLVLALSMSMLTVAFAADPPPEKTIAAAPAETVTTVAQFRRKAGKRIAVEGVVTREKIGDTIPFDGTRVIPLDPAGDPLTMPSSYPGKRVRVTGIAEVWENTQTEAEYNSTLEKERKSGTLKARPGYSRNRLMLKAARVLLLK